ncbi:MAG: hypothetical protein WDN24_01460 [Sphingomonas sp.]
MPGTPTANAVLATAWPLQRELPLRRAPTTIATSCFPLMTG